MYNIKTTKIFDKRFANLGKYFVLSDDEIREATESIKYSMIELQKNGFLPTEYDDHILEDEPWTGFNEYHVLDDLLVIYYRVDKKRNLRFTTIYNSSRVKKR